MENIVFMRFSWDIYRHFIVNQHMSTQTHMQTRIQDNNIISAYSWRLAMPDYYMDTPTFELCHSTLLL